MVFTLYRTKNRSTIFILLYNVLLGAVEIRTDNEWYANYPHACRTCQANVYRYHVRELLPVKEIRIVKVLLCNFLYSEKNKKVMGSFLNVPLNTRICLRKKAVLLLTNYISFKVKTQVIIIAMSNRDKHTSFIQGKYVFAVF